MELLASCSLEKSKTFNGKLTLPNEDKKKPDKVLLNVVINDPFEESIYSKLSGNETCVTFTGNVKASTCPEKYKGKVFNLYTHRDVEKIPPHDDGIVDLVDLSNASLSVKDMLEICDNNSNIRLIGGTILGVEGIRVGRFDAGKEKMSPVFKDMYDTFVEVDLEDLSGIQEIVKKTRVKAEKTSSGSKKSNVTVVKKSPKRLVSFNGLFGGGLGEEF